MPTAASNVQPSSASAIMAAIETIATTQSGLTFAGSSSGNAPTAAEIAGKLPWFCVILARLSGYAVAGELMSAGRGMRQQQVREPVWLFDSYAIYDYNTTNPDTAAVGDALVSLEQGFATYWTLNDTCTMASIVEANARDFRPVIGGKVYLCVKMTIAAYEQLEIIY